MSAVLSALGEVVTAAREVHEWGVTHVLVSLGPDGMVGVSSSEPSMRRLLL